MGTTIVDVKPATGNQTTIVHVVREKSWQAMAVVIVLALIVVYRNSFTWEWAMWMQPHNAYQGGPLIPVISGFIVWFNWKRISSLPIQPTLWGLALVLPSIFIHFVGHRSAAMSLSGLTIVPALFGMCLLLFGVKITRSLLFPLAFLCFMLVPPSAIVTGVSHDIQMKSTVLATGGLKLMGFDAVREGQKIILPNTTVEVAAACSGMSTLVLMMAFGVFMSYMLRGPLWGKLCLVAMIAPLALITNSIRVLVVALVGEFYGHDWMMIVHDYGGYVIVFIAMGLLYLLAKVVRCRDFRSMPES